ncbi:MAG: hypothetical protein RBR24_09650 [Candidatus Carbobacillus sp.]|nr:hypothetical protein [Candidatus Carbobacillus sp.]
MLKEAWRSIWAPWRDISTEDIAASHDRSQRAGVLFPCKGPEIQLKLEELADAFRDYARLLAVFEKHVPFIMTAIEEESVIFLLTDPELVVLRMLGNEKILDTWYDRNRFGGIGQQIIQSVHKEVEWGLCICFKA